MLGSLENSGDKARTGGMIDMKNATWFGRHGRGHDNHRSSDRVRRYNSVGSVVMTVAILLRSLAIIVVDNCQVTAVKSEPEFVLVQNWFEELKRLVPTD